MGKVEKKPFWLHKILTSLPGQLALAIVLGISLGGILPLSVIGVVQTLKSIFNSLINYMVPLIILGFISPAIVSLKDKAGKVLSLTLILCYLSSVGAALLSFFTGQMIIPHLTLGSSASQGRPLPEMLFNLQIDPIMSVMTALVTAILIGLAVAYSQARSWEKLLEEFSLMVFFLVNKVVIKILPLYIATSFAVLSYEGTLIQKLPIFALVLVLVIVGHYVWLMFLYGLAGLVSKTNPWEVVKHYGPAYLTAVGTMSSAATLPVALESAKKTKTLDPTIRDFVIPLCSNTHLCGSVLTETFFVMVVSQILYGQLPAASNMLLFILLLGIFAIGAPGVPGGTIVASLGLITSILHFDATGVALMLSIFALQDSFGTACNITGDGALALMVTGLLKKVPSQKD